MTTQSPHLYSRQHNAADRAGRPAPGGVQTRLPWWAVALPVIGFAALLVLLTGGGADASTAQPAGDLLARLAGAVPDLLRQVF